MGHSGFSYEETVNTLLDLWEEFNNLIPTYRKILAVMQELKKSETNQNRKKLIVDKIPETFLREEFPDISFLNLPTKKEAVAYLNDATPLQLTSLLKCINREKEESVFYRRLSKWILTAKGRICDSGRPTNYHYNLMDEAERKKRIHTIVSSF